MKLIAISREYGSGGSRIGKLVAEGLNVPLYDKQIVDLSVQKSGLARELIVDAELKARNALSYTLSSSLFYDGIYTNVHDINEQLFIAETESITELAQNNEGIIMHNCADYILKDNPKMISVFLYCDFDIRVKKAIDEYNLDKESAIRIVKNYDKARRHYYNYHTSQKWGDCHNYHLAINTSNISDEIAANIIIEFAKSDM